MNFKKLLSGLTRTILAALIFKAFSADILEHYHLLKLPFWQCWEVVIILEAAGHILRGKAAYFFDED